MSCNKQSSNKQPSNNGLSAAGDLSSATLTSIGELVKALEHQGKTVTILEKAGGGIGTGLSVADVLAKMASGDGNGAFVSASGVVLGMAVGAAAAAAAVAFLPAAGVGAAAIFVIGAVGAYIGNEAGKKLGDFLADPTLEPAFYEATLSIREFELRGMGRDPNSDPGVQNMRRQLEKSRRLAGIPSPSDCPIKNIKKKAQIASTYPSPIILDLDGDGVIDTVDLGAGVYFDHAADGFAERTGWVAPGDGLLVWDRNANGTIDTGRELFGSETPLHLAWKAVNGFEALKFHDANGDGIIDANDPVFAELRVWVDANSDARTDTGELLTLEEAGVRSISVAYTNSPHVDAQGNAHRQVGSYTTTEGQTRLATDVWFQADATYSLPTEWVGLTVGPRGECVNDEIWRMVA